MRGRRQKGIFLGLLLAFGLLLAAGVVGCSSEGATTAPGPTLEEPGPSDPVEGERVGRADLDSQGDSGL